MAADHDLHWRDRAACADADSDLFFPASNVGPALVQVSEAKRVCRGCEVREACLGWALDLPIADGVFGGLDARERRVLLSTTRRRRRRHRRVD